MVLPCLIEFGRISLSRVIKAVQRCYGSQKAKIEITGEISLAIVFRTKGGVLQRSFCQRFAVVCDSVTLGHSGLTAS